MWIDRKIVMSMSINIFFSFTNKKTACTESHEAHDAEAYSVKV